MRRIFGKKHWAIGIHLVDVDSARVDDGYRGRTVSRKKSREARVTMYPLGAMEAHAFNENASSTSNQRS